MVFHLYSNTHKYFSLTNDLYTLWNYRNRNSIGKLVSNWYRETIEYQIQTNAVDNNMELVLGHGITIWAVLQVRKTQTWHCGGTDLTRTLDPTIPTHASSPCVWVWDWALRLSPLTHTWPSLGVPFPITTPRAIASSLPLAVQCTTLPSLTNAMRAIMQHH